MDLISAADLARELGVSRQSIYRWGLEIPHVRLPSGGIRWEIEEAQRWIAERRSMEGMGRRRGSGAGSVRRCGASWRARVRVDGRQAERRFRDQREALDWIARVRLEGEAALAGEPAMSLEALIAEFLVSRQERRCRPGTITYYRGHLLSSRGYCARHLMQRPSAIRGRDIEVHLRARRAEGMTTVGVQAEWRALRALLRWATRRGYIPQDPTIGVEGPTIRGESRDPPRVLELLEVAELLETSSERGPEYALGVALLALQGLRQGEVVRLRWEDIDLEACPPRMRVDGKARTESMVIGPLVVQLLAAAGPREGYVIPGRGPRSGPRARPGAARRDRFALEGAPAGITAHTLRRTYATLLEELGTPFGLLRALLRHSTSSSTITSRYLCPRPEELYRSLSALHRAVEDAGRKVTRISR